jgi:hypothetical protein
MMHDSLAADVLNDGGVTATILDSEVDGRLGAAGLGHDELNVIE